MTKTRKQFSPHIYAEWGELFDTITDRERSEILLAITKYPNYEPVDTPIWNFIKSQIQKDYEIFVAKCEKNGEISRNYWGLRKKENIPNDIESNRTISNDIERHPKRITNNDITNNELLLTNNKNKNNDIYCNQHFEKCFKIYSDTCKKLNPLRFERRSKVILEQLSTFLDEIEYDFDYFQELCIKANELEKIMDTRIDFKMMLNNHIGITSGKYKKVKTANDYEY